MSDNEKDQWLRAGSLEGLGYTSSQSDYEMAYRAKQQALAEQERQQPLPQVAWLPRGCLLYAILTMIFAFAIEYLAGMLRLGATSAFDAIGARQPQFVANWIFGAGRVLSPLVGLALFIDWIRYWRGADRGLLRIALYGLRWMFILAVPAAAIVGALLIWGQFRVGPS
jgi:hypothetical protein